MHEDRTVGALYAELGQMLLEQGRPEEAMSALVKAQKEGVNTPTVNLSLGRAYAALHRIDPAIRAFTSAVRDDPSTLEVVQEELSRLLGATGSKPVRGLSEVLRGFFARALPKAREMLREASRLVNDERPEAQEALLRLLAALSEDPESRERLGWLLLEQGQADESRQVFQQLTERYPDNPRYHRGVGEASLKADNVAAAKASFARALELDPADARAVRGLAEARLRAGESAAAVDAFTAALRLDPADVRALVGRSRAHRGEGSLEASLADAVAAVRLDPRNPLAMCEIAEAHQAAGDATAAASAWADAAQELLDRGELEAAEELARRATSAEPSFAPAHVVLGRVLLAQGRMLGAVAVLERAVALDGSVEASLVLGQALLQQQQFEPALDVVERALAADESAPVLALKGTILAALGRNREALAALDTALEADPRNGDACTERGMVLETLGRDEEALAAFQQAVQLAPDRPEAYAGLGTLLVKAEQYEQALVPLGRALEIRPTAQLQMTKGLALWKLERYDDAVAAFDEALRLDPANADATRYRGAALFESERYAEAIAALQLAIDLDAAAQREEDPATHAQLGEALRLSEDFRRAALEFSRAIELDNANAWAYARYGETLRSLGQYEEALEHLTKAVELEPEDGWALGALAAVLVELRRYRSALGACDRAIAISSNDWWSWAYKGVTLRLSSRPDEAVESFDHALQVVPDESWVRIQKAIALRKGTADKRTALELLETTQIEPGTARQQYTESAICKYLAGDLAAVPRLADLALEHDVNAFSYQALKGLAYERLGQPESASEAHQRALGMPGSVPDGDVYLERGRVYAEVGEYPPAIRDFEESIQVNDRLLATLRAETETERGGSNAITEAAIRLAVAYNELAWTYAEEMRENLAEAERLARLAVELAPPEMDPLDRGQILDTLGWVLYREESFEEAAKWLNEAAHLNDESLAIEEHLRLCQGAHPAVGIPVDIVAAPSAV